MSIDKDYAYKELMLQEAKNKLEKMSDGYVKALVEMDKIVTFMQLSPERLLERLNMN